MGIKKSTKRIQANRRKEFNPLLMETPEGRIMVRYRDGGNLPEIGVGGWLKRNIVNVGKGVAGVGLLATGNPAGLGLLSSAATGVASDKHQQEIDAETERLNKFKALQDSHIDRTMPYAPIYKKGGVMKNRRNYKMQQGGIIDYTEGQTHEGPDGGIPVDSKGNVAAASQKEVVALTEKGELSWLMPEGDTYVFSDETKLPGSKKTFAEEAKRISNKYKMYLGKDFSKHDKLSFDSMNKELDQLMRVQESMKGNTYTAQDVEQMMLEQQQDMPMEGGVDMGGMPEGHQEMLPPEMEQMPMMQEGGRMSKRASVIGVDKPYRLANPHRPHSIVRNTLNWEPYTGDVPLSSLAVPLIGNVAGMIDERRRRRTRPSVRLPRTTPRSISLAPARTAAREVAGEKRAAGRRAYRGMGISPGATLAGTSVMETDLNRNLGHQLSESYMQESLSNVKLATEAERTNMEMAMRERMIDREQRLRDEDVSRGYRDAVWNTLNQYFADVDAGRQHAAYLSMAQPEFELQQEVLPGRQRYWKRPRMRTTLRDDLP